MSKEFKAGDKVYYPSHSTEVLTIHKSNSSVYPIHLTEYDFNFTIDGKYVSVDTAPCLIPATPKNHALLEQLYGVEFEAPSVKEVNFKAGDLVYCPLIGTQVFQLEASSSILGYSLGITYYYDDTERFAAFTPEGLEYKYYKTPQIFPATPEMKAKLEQLYGIKLEASPVKPTSKEVIQAMLDDGWKYVPCLVTDKYIVDCASDLIEYDLIVKVLDDTFKSTLVKWYQAFPVDPRTGKLIIDYVDGQIVTE